jgi:MYXO-CTERM domain-containing protein
VLVANYHLFNNSGDAFHWGNAAHTGDCTQTFLFGQADGADYAYEGDVVYHEVFHAVTKQQMGPERELGGIRMLPEAVVLDARNINEGLSDLFSCTYTDDSSYSQYLDQYYWAYVPRELDNAFSCPVSLTGSRHQDSELFSGPLWEAHQALGTPFLVAVIDAIAMLPEDVTYDEASLVLESVVEAELGGAAAETVRDLLDARGAYEPCTRIVPHDAFERQKMFLESPLGSDDLTWVPIRPPPFQIAFAVPDGADTVHFTFGREDLWGDEYDINLLLKPAEPIAFGYQQAGAQVTVTGDSPGGLAGLNSGAGSFSAIPGETVFGAFYNLGADKVAIVDLAVAFSCEAGDGCPAPGDTDGTADGTGGTDEGETGSTGAGGSGGGGCGCRAGDRAGPGAAFGLVVLAARRRRRA